MIIGAQKCGTTSLARQLAAHPQICFCQIKEPGFFNTTEDWRASVAEYHALYDPEPGQICGEASTMYTFLPEWRGTHRRLHDYNPDLKLIYIMRQPVERIISNYSHRLVRKTVAEPPETAVFADPAYLNRTRYSVQIKPYLELFPRENVLFLIFEEYVADQKKTLRQIADFLQMDPQAYPATLQTKAAHKSVGESHLTPWMKRVKAFAPVQAILPLAPTAVRGVVRNYLGNKLEEKPQFSPELKQLLWRFLEDDVRNIEAIIGRRLDIWREEYEL